MGGYGQARTVGWDLYLHVGTLEAGHRPLGAVHADAGTFWVPQWPGMPHWVCQNLRRY